MTKVCYYELIGVERTATASEIKKGYRKRAIEYHPDKCELPNAKVLFQDLNEAYQCLSDPNERTWYDNHRQQILNDKTDLTEEEQSREAFGGIDINLYFTRDCYQDYSDSQQKGYYTVYRGFFEQLKMQEAKAYQETQGGSDSEGDDYFQYPGFGDSNNSDENTIYFYKCWDNFTSVQSFVWADKFNIREAENRYERKYIDKANKKERQKMRREFVITVRNLVDTVKKRDPRYKLIIQQQEKEQREKDILKKQQELEMKLKQKEAKQKAREEEQKRFLQEDNEQEDVDQYMEMNEDVYYCQICDKEFKSDKQLENHNSSKLHKKNYKELVDEVGDQALVDQQIEDARVMAKMAKTGQQQQSKQTEQQSKLSKRSKKNKKQTQKTNAQILEELQVQQSVQVDVKEEQERKQREEQEKETKKLEAKKKKEEQELEKKKQEKDELKRIEKEKLKNQFKSKKNKKKEDCDINDGQQEEDDYGEAYFREIAQQKREKQFKTQVEEKQKIEKQKEIAKQVQLIEQQMRDISKSTTNDQKKSRQEQIDIARQEGRENKKQKRQDKDKNKIEQEYQNNIPKSKKAQKKEQDEDSDYDISKNANRQPQKTKKDKSERINEDLQCQVCKQQYETKNKLFQHIKEKGHATFK